jgi:small subunit ribosomal protein S1
MSEAENLSPTPAPEAPAPAETPPAPPAAAPVAATPAAPVTVDPPTYGAGVRRAPNPAHAPAAAPTAGAPAEATTSAAPAAPATSDPPTYGAGSAAKPAAKPNERGKPEKKRPRGAGDMPNRRMIDPVQLMANAAGLKTSAIKDLDAEIEGELEAAMGGSSSKDLFGVESSHAVQSVPGDSAKKMGKILSIRGSDIFVEVPGGRSQGLMSMMQFEDAPTPPKVGDEIEVSIEGYDPTNGLLILSRKFGAVQSANWTTIAEGMVVEAKVTATNKGGLAIEVNGIRGFMPIGQIDLYRVENAEQFVNQKLICIVTEADPTEKNLVVSRKALLEKQKAEEREKTWLELEENQIRTGIVRNVKPQWAFVDIGGVDGFLHVSEMSWSRVEDASQIVKPGQSIKVAVIKLDKESRKVSLSLKQLEASPWDDLQNRFPIGTVVNGTVTRTMDFGAFVELEPGIEGLVHVSELDAKRVWRVSDIAKEGQAVTVKVLSIDPEARRISLSIRQAIVREAPKPEPEEEEVAAEPKKPERPRNYELRGGIGGGGPLIDMGKKE